MKFGRILMSFLADLQNYDLITQAGFKWSKILRKNSVNRDITKFTTYHRNYIFFIIFLCFPFSSSGLCIFCLKLNIFRQKSVWIQPNYAFQVAKCMNLTNLRIFGQKSAWILPNLYAGQIFFTQTCLQRLRSFAGLVIVLV